MSDAKKTIISTFEIASLIKKYSIKNKIETKYIDFHLIDIAYIHKTKMSNKAINRDSISTIKGNNGETINQKFKIELFKRDKVKFIIKHKIYVNKAKNMAFSILSSDSKMKYYDDLENDLVNYFNKEKAKKKILVSVFDDEMLSSISLLVENIKSKNKVPKHYKIILSSNTSYFPSVENSLSYDYLPNNVTKNDLVNCYCFVKEQQQVISYTKGAKGEDGFNLYGEYCKAKEIRSKNDVSFNVSDNLEIINDKGSSKVIAKISGVLVFKNAKFDIQNNLSFNSLDFRAVRYFNIPLDVEDIILNVKSKVEFENAINDGATIKAHNINIMGDVGPKATIVAVNLTCDGNIHHSTILRATNANLKVLKGKLKAESAKIKTLENGLVVANEVIVDSVVGSEIRAKDIRIVAFYSNNIIKCSHNLDITNMKGNNNTIHMIMSADLDIKKDITRYQNDLLEVKEIPQKDIPIIKRKYIEYKNKVQSLTDKINDKSVDIKLLQKHIVLNQNILDALEKDVYALEHKKTLISHLKKIDELLLQTKIILRNGFNGDTIVLYDYVHKKESLRETPSGFIKHISLVNENNQDVIKLS